jgi:hypothetical protein
MMDEDLEFKVERWDTRGGIESVLARACSVTIARGAFEAAKRNYPTARLTVRIGIQVIAEHPERD